ncbi:MAG TPA: hypothetical protein VKC60_01490 [Opitutaceae bacterium]|nr:hypothetical protein [Opitutaceae bacterium]
MQATQHGEFSRKDAKAQSRWAGASPRWLFAIEIYDLLADAVAGTHQPTCGPLRLGAFARLYLPHA